MKNRAWFVAMLAPALVVIAIAGSRMVDRSAGVALAHVGTGSVHVEIDMVKDGPGANDWCNPVNASATHVIGDNYQVAVCLSDVTTGHGPQSLSFYILYNDSLNTCTDINGGNFAIDDNPDFLQASLGGNPLNWDCNCG